MKLSFEYLLRIKEDLRAKYIVLIESIKNSVEHKNFLSSDCSFQLSEYRVDKLFL